MVIFGFSDSFSNKDINSQYALNELKSFIASGQSVMFTHDTITLRMENADDGKSATINLTKTFRDYVGQSRFMDKFYVMDRDKNNKYVTENSTKKSEYDSNISRKDLYKEYDSEKEDYTERQIPHIDLGANNGLIVGHGLYGKMGQYNINNVYKTNDALISNYPYKLGDISVATTHIQWYQLNLEDEDVVPWFNLSNNSYINKYDSRNAYYTYSKGNITYSGTGHSSGYTADELKLFVNTMIKAERGANHAPTITSNIEKNTDSSKPDMEISTLTDKVQFLPVIRDIDNDRVNVKIRVKDKDGKVINESIYDKDKESGSWVNEFTKTKMPQGTPINLDIKNPYHDYKDEIKSNDKFTIEVEAKDLQGASATETYVIKPTKAPQIYIEYGANDGKGLVGDTIKLNISLEKLNETEKEKITDVKLSLSENSAGIENFKNATKGLNENDFIDNEKEVISWVDNVNNQQFTLTTNVPINGDSITLNLKYKVGDEEKIVQQNIPIYSKKGQVTVKTVDTLKNVIQDFVGYTQLTGDDGFNSKKTVYGLSGGMYTWPDSSSGFVKTTSYKLTLTPKNTKDYPIQSYEIQYDNNKSGNTSGTDNTANIGELNYDNPTVTVIYRIKQKVISSNNNKLKILEVQPGNVFTITKKSDGYTTSGIEKIVSEDANGHIKDIEIDHILMSEFIGKVDELNGCYDVIIIGREKGKDDNKWGGAQYSDYSAIDDNGKDSGYIENDITKRKSEEIKEFLNSGQTVFIDNKISENNGVYSDIKESNLYKLYNSIDKNKADFYDSITLDGVIKACERKRPTISIKSPAGDETSVIDDGKEDQLGNINNRNLSFMIKVNDKQGYTGSYNVKLYLDINGDGIYTSDEVANSKENINLSSNEYNLKYNMSQDFIGQLNWKIEIKDTNNIKSYLTGKINLRRVNKNQKRDIKVLQISPESGINLGTDQEFTKLLNAVRDYDVKITTVSVSDFNKKASNDYTGKDKIILNGNYDMVILGFSDLYNQKDITDKSALKQIEDFIKSKQGVMFTHDTILSNDISGKSTNLRKTFRDYVGQTRFKPLSDENNQTFTEGYYTSITHDVFGKTHERKTGSEVQQTNKGIITDYPYDLSKETVKNVSDEITETYPSVLGVGDTCTQYFQLNFEDPTVVPWYNVKGSDNNSYNSRNDYYTYTKGNIVFCGSGSSASSHKEYELKLIVNSLIKCERGANHAPIIETTIPETTAKETIKKDGNDIEVIYNDKFNYSIDNYKFDVRVTDIDKGDTVDLAVSVKKADSETWENIYDKKNVEQGVNIQQEINRRYWEGLEDKVFEVKIEAVDNKGAKSEKTYKLFPTNKPVLSLSDPTEGKGLIGDTISASINLNKENIQNNDDIQIESISTGEYNTSIFKEIILPNAVSFENNVGKATIQTVTLQEVEKAYIPIIVKYKVCNEDEIYETTIDVPISSKKGEIHLKISSDDDLEINPTATLYRGEEKDIPNIPVVSSEDTTINSDKTSASYSWPDWDNPPVTSGTYSIGINNLDELNAQVQSEKGQNAKLNYDNPTANIEIKLTIGKDGRVISHGFLTVTGNTYKINEPNSLDVNATINQDYDIGTEVEVLRNKSELNVVLPNTATINKTDDKYNITLYEINSNNTITSVSQSYSINVEKNVIKVTGLKQRKKYLLAYNAKFSSNSDLVSKLINKTGTSEKVLKIIVDEGDIISHGLLDLKSDDFTITENDKKDINAIKDMYYRIGLEAEICRKDSELQVVLPNTAVIDNNHIKVYQVSNTKDNTKEIKDVNGLKISVENNNTIKITGLNPPDTTSKQSTYLISYVAKFTEKSPTEVTLVGKLVKENKEKPFYMVFKGPDQNGSYIPEAF